jgi:hypothetical protein
VAVALRVHHAMHWMPSLFQPNAMIEQILSEVSHPIALLVA